MTRDDYFQIIEYSIRGASPKGAMEDLDLSEYDSAKIEEFLHEVADYMIGVVHDGGFDV